MKKEPIQITTSWGNDKWSDPDSDNTTSSEIVNKAHNRERCVERRKLKAMREALEAADECLALIEDVGHGAHMDNVTVARGIVLRALDSENAKAEP